MTEKYYKEALPPHNPRKNKKQKTKNIKHKIQLRERKPPSVKTFGCLIKALRHDEKGMSPLNVFIAPCSSPRQSLSRGPEILKNMDA